MNIIIIRLILILVFILIFVLIFFFVLVFSYVSIPLQERGITLQERGNADSGGFPFLTMRIIAYGGTFGLSLKEDFRFLLRRVVAARSKTELNAGSRVLALRLRRDFPSRFRVLLVKCR